MKHCSSLDKRASILWEFKIQPYFTFQFLHIYASDSSLKIDSFHFMHFKMIDLQHFNTAV